MLSSGTARERERELRLVLERARIGGEHAVRELPPGCAETSERDEGCEESDHRATSALAIARTKYASGIFFSLSTGAGTKSSAKRNAA